MKKPNMIHAILASLLVAFSISAAADQLSLDEVRSAKLVDISRFGDINHQTVRGKLTDANVFRVYKINLTAGDSLSLTTKFRDNLHGAIYVYNNRNLLDGKAPKNIKTVLNLDFIAPSTGAYYVLVEASPFSKRANQSGRFVLDLWLRPVPKSPSIVFGIGQEPVYPAGF